MIDFNFFVRKNHVIDISDISILYVFVYYSTCPHVVLVCPYLFIKGNPLKHSFQHFVSKQRLKKALRPPIGGVCGLAPPLGVPSADPPM